MQGQGNDRGQTHQEKPRVLVVGEPPENGARYERAVNGHGIVKLARNIDDATGYINSSRIVVANVKQSLIFSALANLHKRTKLDWFVIPISGGRPAQVMLGDAEIQTMSPHDAPDVVAEILRNLRDGRPPQILPLSAVMLSVGKEKHRRRA